ncbi:hypothetical protein BDQ17DRAFT_1252989, partial [Cyathus striatus]
VCSDDAGNTHKACQLIAQWNPQILNFADACHNLHNACKDICNIEAFKPVHVNLLNLYCLFSFNELDHKPTAGLACIHEFINVYYNHYRAACSELGITRGLQWIGETRFATIYWSADSVLRGIAGFKQIVCNSYEFQCDLKQLHAVLQPLAHAIKCLEASQTNTGHVYVFWLAVVVQLQDIIVKDDTLKSPKYLQNVKCEICRIVNFRFHNSSKMRTPAMSI